MLKVHIIPSASIAPGIEETHIFTAVNDKDRKIHGPVVSGSGEYFCILGYCNPVSDSRHLLLVDEYGPIQRSIIEVSYVLLSNLPEVALVASAKDVDIEIYLRYGVVNE